MRTPFRQGIVKAPASFLVPSGGTVSLNIAPLDHALVTFADGDANYLIAERQSVPNAWSGPFIAGTDYWLYWDINNRTGVRTFGYTLREPVESNVAPLTPAPDQHWFDTANKRMKVWNATSGQWVNKIRVFAAKLQAGSVLVSMSYESPAFTGTQVGLFQSIPAVAGALVFDINGDPVRRSNGTFFTTEDAVTTGISSAAMVKLGSVVIDAVAAENIPAYSIVRFSDFHQIELASNYVSVNGTYGLIEMDATTGAVVNVVMEGVITNPNWDWSAAGVNAPLFSDETGQLTTIQPPNGVVVATVIDTNTILLRAAIVTYTEGQGVVLPTLTLQEEGVTVQEEVTVLNVVGANVTATAGAVGTGIITVSVPTPPTLTVEEEGSSVQTNVTSLNFVGANVTAAAGTAGEAVITVSVPTPPSISLSEEGVVVQTDVTDINFVGANVTVTAGGAGEGVVTVSVPTPPSLAVQEEGSNVQTNVTSINFVGASVTATAGGAGEAIVTFTPPTVTPLEVQDNAVVVDSDVNTINFGTGITVTPGAPGAITVSAADPVLFDQDLNTFNSVEFTSVTTPVVVSDASGDFTITTNVLERSTWWSTFGDATLDAQENYPSASAFDSVGNVLTVTADGNAGTAAVIKQSRTGTRVWEQTLSSPTAQYLVADAIAVDESDNVYAAISINDAVKSTVVTKFSSTGTVLWSREITQPTLPAGKRFVLHNIKAKSGVLVLSGDSGYDVSGPASEAVVMTLDPATGSTLWQRLFRQTNVTWAPVASDGVDIDALGNILVAMTMTHSEYANPELGLRQTSLAAVHKLSPAGVVVWSKYIESSTFPPESAALVLAAMPNGDVAVGVASVVGGWRKKYVAVLNGVTGAMLSQHKLSANDLSQTDLTTFYGMRADSAGNLYVLVGSEFTANTATVNSELTVFKFNPRDDKTIWVHSMGTVSSDDAWWYWGTDNIDVTSDRYVVSAYAYYGNGGATSNAEVITAVLPTDGTALGTYGAFTYYVTPYYVLEATNELITGVPATVTIATTGLTNAASALTVGPTTSELTVVPVYPATSSWAFSASGIETPNYTLPIQRGIAGQVLRASTGGTVMWDDVDFNQQLNTYNTVAFESVTTPVAKSDTTGDFKINVIDQGSPAWWSSVGDFTADLGEDFTSAAVFDSEGSVLSVHGEGNNGSAYVVKQDRDGNVVWQVKVQPPQAAYTSGEDICVDKFNNVYFVAVTEEAFFRGTTLFKLDGRTGQLIWSKNFSSISHTRFVINTIAVNDNGELIAGGKFGSNTNTNMTTVFVKLTTDGDYIWSTTLTQPAASGGASGVYAIELANNGSVFAQVQVQPATTPTPNTYAGLIKLNSDGTLAWQKTYSANTVASAPSYPLGLTLSPAGRLFTAFSLAWQQYARYILEIDTDTGATTSVTNVQVQPVANFQYNGIALRSDAESNLYIFGTVRNFNDVTPRTEFIVTKIYNGTFVWSRTLGTASDEYTFWSWNTKNLDVNENSVLVSGYTYGLTTNFAEGFTSVWPSDGTGTGTYGAMTYAVYPHAVTITSPSSEVIEPSISTVTTAVGTNITTASDFTVIPNTAEVRLTSVYTSDNSWTFSRQGLTTPNYTLPFVDGTAGQTLVTNGAGAVTWQTAGGGSSAITYTDATKNLYVTTYSIANPASGTGNVALGNEALIAVTTGSNNVSVGSDSLKGVTVSMNNVSLGTNNANSFDSAFRGHNIIIGNDNGPSITTYDRAVVIGNNVQAEVEYASVLGSDIFIDDNVGSPLPTKPYVFDSFVSANSWSLYRNLGVERSQVAVSRSFLAESGRILNSVVLGDYIANESVGSLSRTVTDSVLIGPGTGYAINSSNKNLAITYYGLAHNTTGQSNIAIGEYALEDNTTGSYNVAIGYWSQFNSTAGEYNAALGAYTLQNVTTGSYNSAVGNYVLGSLSTGTYNDGQGSFCLNSVTTGQYNVGMGGYALNSIGTGSNNVGVGYGAGLSVGGTGFDNAFVGYRSVAGVNTSAGTVAVGCETAYLPSGTTATTTDCILIGKRAGDLSLLTTGRAYTNVIVIGAGIQLPDATVSNTIYMGNSSITAANIPVAWTVTSDARDKTDIIDLDVGLEFVNQLRPRKFKLMNRDTQQATTGDRYGLVTQEILEVDQTTPIVDQSDADRLRLNETMMIPVLINAIQELSAQLNELKAELNTLKGE